MTKTAILTLFKRVTKYQALQNYYEKQHYIQYDEMEKAYCYNQFATTAKILRELLSIIDDFNLNEEYALYYKSPECKKFYNAVKEFYNAKGVEQQ